MEESNPVAKSKREEQFASSSSQKIISVAVESRLALVDYIEKHQVTTAYGCWAGDEHLTPVATIEVSAAQLRDVRFALPERSRMKIQL